MSFLFRDHIPSKTYGSYNKDSEDYGTLAAGRAREPRKAFCTSQSCCTYEMKSKLGKTTKATRNKIRKETSKMFCPDCGFALLWD